MAALAGCASSPSPTSTDSVSAVERRVRAASSRAEAGYIFGEEGRTLLVETYDEVESTGPLAFAPGIPIFDWSGRLQPEALRPGQHVLVFIQDRPTPHVIGVRLLTQEEARILRSRYASEVRPFG